MQERRQECRREEDKKLIDVDVLLADLKLAQRKLRDVRLHSVDVSKAMDELYAVAVHQDHYARMRDMENRINGSISAVVIK